MKIIYNKITELRHVAIYSDDFKIIKEISIKEHLSPTQILINILNSDDYKNE